MMMNSKNLKGIDSNVVEIISSHLPGETDSNYEFMSGYAVLRSRFDLQLPHKNWHITCTPTCVAVLFTKNKYGLNRVRGHVFHRETIPRIPTKCITKISHQVL